MQLARAFLNKRQEVGIKESTKLALAFLSNRLAGKLTLIPYYIAGITDFYLNPVALKQYDMEQHNVPEKIRKQFIDSGIDVLDYTIDKADFNRWLGEINFPTEYTQAYGHAFTEKALEHYIASALLKLNETDVYVDVAASGSPYYDQAEKKYKCKSYAVDLHLPANREDPRLIECDATDMPFEDGSISKMALHCAFEMFENDADIRFLKEASRVLGIDGKMVIIPLYMAHVYYILSGTKSNRHGINYGKAKRVWWSNRNHNTNRFTRYYSVEAFLERIVNNLDGLSTKIYYFTNEQDLKQKPEDLIYVKFAACFTKEAKDDSS